MTAERARHLINPPPLNAVPPNGTRPVVSESPSVHIHTVADSPIVAHDKVVSMRVYTKDGGSPDKNEKCKRLDRVSSIVTMAAGTTMHKRLDRFFRLAASTSQTNDVFSEPTFYSFFSIVQKAHKAVWGNQKNGAVGIPLDSEQAAIARQAMYQLAGPQNEPRIRMENPDDQPIADGIVKITWHESVLPADSLVLLSYLKEKGEGFAEGAWITEADHVKPAKHSKRLAEILRSREKRWQFTKSIGVDEPVLGKYLLSSVIGGACPVVEQYTCLVEKAEASLNKFKARPIPSPEDEKVHLFDVSLKTSEIESVLLMENFTREQVDTLLAIRLVSLASDEMNYLMGGKVFPRKYSRLQEEMKRLRKEHGKPSIDYRSQEYKNSPVRLQVESDLFHEILLLLPEYEFSDNPRTSREDAKILAWQATGFLERGRRAFYARYGVKLDAVGIIPDKTLTDEQKETQDEIIAEAKKYADLYYKGRKPHPLDDPEYWQLMERAVDAGCKIQIVDFKRKEGPAPDRLLARDKRTVGVNMLHLFNLLAVYEKWKHKTDESYSPNVMELMGHKLVRALDVKVVYLGRIIDENKLTPDIKEYPLAPYGLNNFKAIRELSDRARRHINLTFLHYLQGK